MRIHALTTATVAAAAFAACGPKPTTAPPELPTTPPSEPAPPAPAGPNVADARQWLGALDKDLKQKSIDASVADWANQTDITPAHEEAAAARAADLAKFITRSIKDAQRFEPIAAQLSPAERRQLLLLKFIGQPAPDDPAQADELAKLGAEMTSIYGKGKACLKTKANQCLDVDAASKLLRESRDPKVLLDVWTSWHDTVGRAERDAFAKFVPLANAGAKAIGFSDVASMWKSGYDMPEAAFEAEVDRLWLQTKPLYDQLHCYARRKLSTRYGAKVQPATGPIMAHLTGNMWAQSWIWLYPDLEPAPGQAAIDVTPAIAKKLDEKGMVKFSEAFYTSLGMPALPATFWERSMFVKPPGKEVVCHASAWDVTFSSDLRIKMCIEKTQESLKVIHHELGHNYYQMSYTKLPVLFQNGANDGFHEAIGDTVALSMTPGYLKERGLLDRVVKNDKQTLNQQMRIALEKIAFLPFGIVIDKWRWDVFAGKVAPDKYNEHWWALRAKYQGVAPAVARAATDFDPGAKYHVPANVAYTRYFLAAILQFQFHRALCQKAGHTGPLHECSIYKNEEAGKAFWKLLETGASKPWQDTLFDLTGQREMDATAMLEYFAPLKTWLETQNQGKTCGY